MSWFTLALGLIREAATTETGQDILNDMRSGTRRGATASPKEPVDPWRQSIERRLGVADRNTESLVKMLNAQDAMLVRIQKRQRIWNVCLTTAIALTAGLLVWAWLG